MDAEGRIIPIVEDDQGEGFKDPLDFPNNRHGRRKILAMTRTHDAYCKCEFCMSKASWKGGGH